MPIYQEIEAMKSNIQYYAVRTFESLYHTHIIIQIVKPLVFRPQWYNVVYIFDTIPTYMNDAI